MVPNTKELLPEPDTPVNTVSRRFGISTLMSFRLFSRAPRTRIRSWLSARGSAAGRAPAMASTLNRVSFVVVEPRSQLRVLDPELRVRSSAVLPNAPASHGEVRPPDGTTSRDPLLPLPGELRELEQVAAGVAQP